LEENPVGVHPLDPQNRFIIAVGPVTGSGMWSRSRFAVFTKSPATGGYGESYCGDRAALFDSLILCRFFRDFIKWEELSDLITATTGMRLAKQDLQSMANRITERTRRYNLREGIDSSHDHLPPYLLDNPTREGASISSAELQTLIEQYNYIRRNRA
jgi:aldehyde:ferredoxin oxidoreductase